ncbi:hypothetical protein PO909_018933 [Leuciscus waleckii]
MFMPQIMGLRGWIFFMKMTRLIKKIDSNVCIVVGGDWNCTTDFTIDRNGEEPHSQSSMMLTKVLNEFELIDVWRMINKRVRQYTWLKVNDNRVSGARLDRFYLGKVWNNRVMNTSILPNGFSDHHMVIFDFNLKNMSKPIYYWHFNAKLLQDIHFCDSFVLFWKNWKTRKSSFENLNQWWDVGKVNIRMLCQNYSSHIGSVVRDTVKRLQRDIELLEQDIFNNNNELVHDDALQKKNKELGTFLQEQVKTALIRARFCSIKDMDTPSTYFFNLEKKSTTQKQMYHLRRHDGSITTDPAEIRKMSVDFYSQLYASENCNHESAEDLLSDLPKIESEQRKTLDENITFQELTEAMQQLSTGRSPGIDGLTAEFYQCFWGILGEDFYEVLSECCQSKILPTSCSRAVLSLLPKKGDLGLLKNWRPVSLLCVDYKIFSKCLANRLKFYLGLLVQKDQTYCIPERFIMDNISLLRDVIELSQLNNYEIGVLSLDQEKAFDRVDHGYLYNVLQHFGFGENFISYIQLLYSNAVVLVKAGGGLSAPIPVSRGIRQGCPLSGQLYSLVIEPLLCRLRRNLNGVLIPNGDISSIVSVSAYADDVTVFIKGQDDVTVLTKNIEQYEKASSAKLNWGKTKVNWAKCEGFAVGSWVDTGPPQLPEGLKWGKEGFKVLGVYLGTDKYKEKNWEGLLGKVVAKLSKWNWLLPELSYRGRVLTNNLTASMLWHKLNVLEPPEDSIKEIQRKLVDFSGLAKNGFLGRHFIYQ